MVVFFFFFLMIRRPPRSTRTDTLFPYTTLFRSGLAKGGDNADRYRHPLVGRPCRFRGRFAHEGHVGAGWSTKPRPRRALADMVRHRLIPRCIVGQVGYVETKLFRDEGGEIMGYRSIRSEERRAGNEGVRTWRHRWPPNH